MRCSLCIALATAFLALVSPADSAAQGWLDVAGGVTLPQGEYKDLANTGWLAHAAAAYPLGDSDGAGPYLGASAYYGRNKHEAIDGDKTNHFGVLGRLGYALGDPEASIAPFAFVHVGFMRDAYESNTSVDESAAGLAAGGGAGVSFPLYNRSGGVPPWRGVIELSYLSRFGDNDIPALSDTQIVSVELGVRIPVLRRIDSAEP